MKTIVYILAIPLLLLMTIACNSETKEEKVNPAELEKAWKEYATEDYTFVDTLIKYELKEKEISLDFGNPDETRWSIAVIFKQPNGKELATKIGLSYFLENGKVSLPYPEGINSKKDAENLYLAAVPAGITYISRFPGKSKRVEIFIYHPVKEGVLKITGDDWYQMNDITHKLNYMKNPHHSVEIKEALYKKEVQLIKKIRNQYK